jgi:hypothetical protein
MRARVPVVSTYSSIDPWGGGGGNVRGSLIRVTANFISGGTHDVLMQRAVIFGTFLSFFSSEDSASTSY